MTVKELIKQLSKYPEDLHVFTETKCGDNMSHELVRKSSNLSYEDQYEDDVNYVLLEL